MANKKSQLTKTINSNHWNNDVCQAALEKKILNKKIKRQKAFEKARKEQEKLDKQMAEEIQKTLNKLTQKVEAAEIWWKKK